MILEACQIHYDVEQLLHASASRHFETVVRLYKGEFLGGVLLPRDVALDHWRDAVEADVRSHVMGAYHRFMLDTENTGNWEEAGAWADHVLSLDDWDEQAHSVRLKSIAALFGIEEAVARASRTRALFASARLEIRTPDLITTLGMLEDASQNREPRTPPQTLRLRGREVELAQLAALWSTAASGRGCAALITGESEVGKTRVAEHFLRWAAIKGSRVLLAKSSAAESRLRWSGLIELLRSGCAAEPALLLEDPWRKQLAGLLPELSCESPRTGQPQTAKPVAGRRQVLAAAAKAFEQATGSSGPLMVFLDDANWCDEQTAWAIHFALSRSNRRGMLVIMTSRTGLAELPEQLRLPFETLAADDRLVVELGPLQKREAISLAAEAAEHLRSRLDPSLLTSVICSAAGRPGSIIRAVDLAGRPLAPLALELIEDSKGVVGDSFPDLSKAGRFVLESLAIIGGRSTEALLSRLVNLPVVELRPLLTELSRKGLVRQACSEVELAGEDLRERLLEALGASAIRELSECAARVLGTAEAVPPGVLAIHYAAAGRQSPAHRWALHAARAAVDGSLLKDAEFYLQMAVHRASTLAEQQAASVAMIEYLCLVDRLEEARRWSKRHPSSVVHLSNATGRMLSLYELVAEGNGCMESLSAEVTSVLADQTWQASADRCNLLRRVLVLAHSTGNVGMTQELVHSIYRRRPSFPVTPESIKLLSAVSVVWCLNEDAATGLELAKEAVCMAADLRDKPAHAAALITRGTARMLLGQLRYAELDFTLAERLSVDANILTYLDRMQINRAVMLIETRRAPEAVSALEFVIPQANVDDQVLARANLAVAALEAGDIRLLRKRVSDLRRGNAQPQFPWAESLADCMEGYVFDAEGDLEAVARTADRLRGTLVRTGAAGSDSSYAETLIGRSIARRDESAALDYLERASRRHARGNILGMLRLRVEAARILGQSNSAASRQMALESRRACEELGASTLARRAQCVLEGSPATY